MPSSDIVNLAIERLGVMAILAVALVFTLRYMTSSLSKQIEECKQILIKLIDRFNLSDSNTKTYRDSINEKLDSLESTIDRKWKD
jgi:hypothetical protein|tara:strand:- start:2090 stop:2344 length:255 start_codon:yes stop_codon:yes gene_type:complete